MHGGLRTGHSGGTQVLPLVAGLEPWIHDNVMINDAASPSGSHSRISLFVDDIAMWTRSRNPHFMAKKLQVDVCRIEQWAQKWGFVFSGSKSKFIIFTRKRKAKDKLLNQWYFP